MYRGKFRVRLKGGGIYTHLRTNLTLNLKTLFVIQEQGGNIKEAANTEIVSESGTFLSRPSSCQFNCQTKAMEGDEMNVADQYKPGGGVG